MGASSTGAPVEVLGTGPDRLDPDHDAGPVTASRPTALVVVGGLLAVVALLWALGRPDEPEPVSPQVVAPTVPVPTTERPSASVPTTAPVVVDAPVVGEPSGLSLLIGGSGPLQSLDLDSGELTRYGVIAHPVLVTGDDLVLYQESAGIVGWVPMTDPGQQVMGWKRGHAALGSEPGLLWVLDAETDEPHPDGVAVGFGRWELFDTASNRRLSRMPGDLYDEVEAYLNQSPRVGGAFDALRPGPWFSTRPDGVYRSIDDGYARLAEGRLVASDEEAVLSGWCSADGPCDLVWVGVDSGAPIDRVLPEVRPRVARIVAEGAWLHSVGWDGTSELLELATGRRLVHDWTDARPTISSDGRWLAHWVAGRLILSDLAGAGEPRPVATLEELPADPGDSLLFTASPSVRASLGAATSS